jgi:hypothetical protein
MGVWRFGGARASVVACNAPLPIDLQSANGFSEVVNEIHDTPNLDVRSLSLRTLRHSPHLSMPPANDLP